MIVKPCDWTVEYFLANESDCIRILEDSDALQEIPCLNSAPLDYFKDGQLVRFHGMVQDMHNPEYFFKTYKVVNLNTGEHSIRCGMYSDGAKCQPHEKIAVDSDTNESQERQTWMVVSTPGLNDWAKENYQTKLHEIIKLTEKDKTDSTKRSIDEVQEPMDCSEPIRKKEKTSDDADAGSSQSKGANKPVIVSIDHILNLPLPNKDGKACIVKIYQEYPYKLNEVIDIVGFLSLDLNLSKLGDCIEMMDDLEKQTHYPPVTLVPRLHAVRVVEKVNKYIPEVTDVLLKAERIRGDLRMILSQLLFGDDIAAEYLICHLISSVYLRQDCLSLGAFSLNITHFPKEHTNFIKEFYDILKQIIAKSHYLEITLDNLNDLTFTPKKDYDCNRLTSGILQLSKNTHLIVNETTLTAGQVNACGRQNYSALSDLILFQKLSYDFKFYNMDYETDVPVLIFSEVKSFIPCNNQIVLRPDPETVNHYPQVLEAAKQYLKDETKLNDIRHYVNALKNAKFELSEDVVNIIQEDFVSLRQSDKKFSADNLHSLMVFSRLMALSHGVTSLKPEIWKRSIEIEKERIKRL